MTKPKKKTQSKDAEATAIKSAQSLADTSETQNLSVASPAEPARPKPQSLEEILKDQPVYVNSIAAGLLGLDRGSVLRELQHARATMLRFYLSEGGGKRTLEEALKLVNAPPDDEFTEQQLQQVLTQSVEQISWCQLEQIYQRAPKVTRDIWQSIKDEARDELKTGHRMAAALEPSAWEREPWLRAQFLAIRNGFVEEWRPKGAIELALIDMMAQTFSEYLYWSREVHHRSTSDAKILYTSEEERRIAEVRGHWLPPRLSERDAIEHEMMDRYNRLFLRTLRQLRDLRRYSPPVTINNPQQVNIAADGGQQFNIAQDEPPKSK
jgi:hypothetical protein